MSFDIFLQCYRNGEPATFKREIYDEIFGRYDIYDDASPEITRVRFPDRSGGDVYLDQGDDIQCMMFNHCGGEAFFEALYQLAARTQSIIFWPEVGPCTAITDPLTLKHLPDTWPEKLGPARLVRNGHELQTCIFGEGEQEQS